MGCCVLVHEGGAGLYRWKRLLNGTSAQEVTSGTPSAVASMGTAALSSVHGVGAKANKYRVAASIADLRCERRVSYQHATLWTASGREVVATPERPSSRANIVSAAVRLARVRGIERGGGAGDERGGGGGREAAPLLAKTNL